MQTPAPDLVPVTILTGFLGSGKTTLLRRLLHAPHGRRIAVVENEFGQVGIDHALLVHESAEQIVEMNNGCICCTVRGDLVRILGDLAARRRAGTAGFDHVVIETTGLADPAPVAQTFFMDDAVCEHYRLDAIVTLVDAKHAMQQLDRHVEAQQQVAFADCLLVSKSDLAASDGVAALEARLRRLNPTARLRRAHFGEAPVDDLLALDAFNLSCILERDPAFLGTAGHAHSHHHHSDSVTSFTFGSDLPFDAAMLEAVFGALLQVHGPKLLRYKGILSIAGHDRRVVLQGVHMVMGSDQGPPWQDGERRSSRIVFIVKDLPATEILQALDYCLQRTATPLGEAVR